MPLVLSFDIEGAHHQVRNRIQSMFMRLGWEHLGGSAYRHPKLGTEQPVEDWLNHVIPGLMLFRTLLRDNNITLTKFTIDVQSSAGFTPTGFGQPPRTLGSTDLYPTHQKAFGEAKLLDWINNTSGPY